MDVGQASYEKLHYGSATIASIGLVLKLRFASLHATHFVNIAALHLWYIRSTHI